ncbi:MAG: dienelactone hydrolase family protein [Sporocytophaga sp.]|uniref:alpha/beta hydrolase family protein n=1 Tax=Sporocytophaga sp. TaxID=2231183 RepID=UPI001B0E4A35|nr:alpha/beta family hydrolase [Sporocytophaga sp.]MBO9702584.1 dienelactone hydrolase family protein [Sporocytophaga sp.]
MKTRSLSFAVSPEIGKVSAELIIPDDPICIMTLAHGAGAGMNHEFMVSISKSLAEKNFAILRFNFPFMENQKRRPDSPAVAHKTIEVAIKKAYELFPSLPVFVAGKSFGGRMSSQYLAMQPTTDVKGIIFFGFPLHQPGKPSLERAEHLKSIAVPMLFLQGTKDTLASNDLIEKVCASLHLATLITIEKANHAFKAGKQDLMPILIDSTKLWVHKQIRGDTKS